MGKSVEFTCRTNKEVFPVSSAAQLGYVLIEAKPRLANVPTRTPLNLSLVLDRSGSMKGKKIENVREAVCQIIDRLNEDDILSVVAFNDAVELLIPAQPVTRRDELKNLVKDLVHRGGTAISKGMELGLAELNKHNGGERINRMLLLTDGETYGDEDDCCILAKQAASDGIAVTALGVGDEWNEEIVDAIANYSSGKSDYIESPEDIVRFFADEVREMQSIVVQNAEMTMRLAEGVTSRRVFRVIPMISDLGAAPLSEHAVTVQLGELNETTGQSLLVELALPVRPVGKFRIAQVELDYDVLSEGKFGERERADVVIQFSEDANLSKKIQPDIMNIVEKVTAFNLQTRALNDAAGGNIQAATQKLRAAATRLLNLGEAELADSALTEADNLERQGKMSSSGTKKLRYETRKLTQRLVTQDDYIY
ncbi:VWA domain-containing protein [candidate division KSB1 bacterium]|nr:VWA domain-containing protein [candidate division KSB1 bacterium]